MTAEEKKAELKKSTLEVLQEIVDSMPNKIDRVLKSGCIDFDGFDANSLVLPKAIIAALVEDAASDYLANKVIKKEYKNIKKFS
jgi:histidinol dehydrogenase